MQLSSHAERVDPIIATSILVRRIAEIDYPTEGKI